MIVTMIGEKSFQIDLPAAALTLDKSNGAKQSLVRIRTCEGCIMNPAQINKIQRSSAHDKHGFKIACVTRLLVRGLGTVTNFGKVIEDAALVGQLELTDSDQLVLYCGSIRQQIGVESDVTLVTKLLLLSF